MKSAGLQTLPPRLCRVSAVLQVRRRARGKAAPGCAAGAWAVSADSQHKGPPQPSRPTPWPPPAAWGRGPTRGCRPCRCSVTTPLPTRTLQAPTTPHPPSTMGKAESCPKCAGGCECKDLCTVRGWCGRAAGRRLPHLPTLATAVAVPSALPPHLRAVPVAFSRWMLLLPQRRGRALRALFPLRRDGQLQVGKGWWRLRPAACPPRPPLTSSPLLRALATPPLTTLCLPPPHAAAPTSATAGLRACAAPAPARRGVPPRGSSRRRLEARARG